MKRWKLLLAALCCLLLCACGTQKQVTGRVTALGTDTMSVTTEEGKTYDFVVKSPDTVIFNLAGDGPEEFQDNWQNCRVQVSWSKKQGERIAEIIWVDAVLRRNVQQLSDGTAIDVWDYNGWREYCLEDGTTLLMEENPGGPESNSYWNELLYNEEFPAAAQQGIVDYYEQMGLRYDIPSLLEDAWVVYSFSEEYNAKLVGQHIELKTWNEKIICCQMNLTIPKERTNGQADSFCEGAVFDRETGEHISNYDLFTCTPEVLEAFLLDQLDQDGTLDRAEIVLNLKPEQIILQGDGGVEFWLKDCVQSGAASMMIIGLSPEEAREILQPWAVMGTEEKAP